MFLAFNFRSSFLAMAKKNWTVNLFAGGSRERGKELMKGAATRFGPEFGKAELGHADGQI